MSERPSCVGCGESAPETNTNYTLISTDFGWRLMRRTLPGGEKIAEWRCPTCWRAHKATGQPPGPLRPTQASAAGRSKP
jgi:hypothetical protein